MKNLKILLLALIFLIAGFLFGQSWQVSQVDNTSQFCEFDIMEVKPISLMLDFGSGDIKTFSDIVFSEGETVFNILERMSSDEEGFTLDFSPPGEWGVLINQIGEKKNGEDNKYWQYWVNNEQPMVAADRYELQSGETIMFKFTESKF